jgi:hypothetical protein
MFRECLCQYKKEEYNLDQEMCGLDYLPLVTISKDFWVPTACQLTELEAESNATGHGYIKRRMMVEWAEQPANLNGAPESTQGGKDYSL